MWAKRDWFWFYNWLDEDWAVCGLSLHPGSTESRKTLEQKIIFQIDTPNGNPNGINERFYQAPTNSVAPYFCIHISE